MPAWLAPVLLAGAIAVGASSAATVARAAGPVTIAASAAWCWFADPRAVAYRGRAVFGRVGGDGSIEVGDDLGRRGTLDPGLERDDHDNPAFLVRRDGRLTAFWSAHNGPVIRSRTTIGKDIRAWGPVRDVAANPPGTAGGVTYPNPVRAGSTLYLFWSGAGTTATYATSGDDGDTWSAPRPLFDPAGPRARYVKYRGADDEIHLAWTLGHPREGTSAVRHAVIRGDRLERQDGRRLGRLGTPLPPTAGDVVRARDRAGAWIHDLAVRRDVPTIAYATFPSPTAHRYRRATWSAGRWVDEQVATAGGSFEEAGLEPHYSGGITLDPRDPDVAYASRARGAHHELDRLHRTLEGWTTEPITRGSPADQMRPYPVAGGLAWMRGRYPTYTTFLTGLVWRPPGSHGVIGRAPPVPRVTIAPSASPGRAWVRGTGAGRLELRVARRPAGPGSASWVAGPSASCAAARPSPSRGARRGASGSRCGTTADGSRYACSGSGGADAEPRSAASPR